MTTNNHVDDVLRKLYATGQSDLETLLEPLARLAENSSSLFMGYGATQKPIRENLIPYFHVTGQVTHEIPVIRALLLGGTVGTDSGAFLTVARLLSAMESRLKLAEGLEITAYPVVNVEAYRQHVFLTGKQQIEGVKLWENSPCTHVQVLERELLRYAYDLVIVLREDRFGVEAGVENWPGTPQQEQIIEGMLLRYAEGRPGFRWQTRPEHPLFERLTTPIPKRQNQPAEVVVGLPGTRDALEQSDSGIQVLLCLLHAMRQARMEGVL